MGLSNAHKNARELCNYHTFTKQELYDTMELALKKLPDSFWAKPNSVNRIFDNGYYYNLCMRWINNSAGEFPDETVAYGVMQTFSEFSNVQLPKRVKAIVKVEVEISEKPIFQIINQKNRP